MPSVVVALDDTSDEETMLRERLKQKPKSAKLMSKLSCLLMEQAKSAKTTTVEEQINIKKMDEICPEAMKLAKIAVEIAPQKPYGYMAISIVSSDHSERHQALQTATTLLKQEKYPQFESVQWKISLLNLSVRLLIEPRNAEANTVRGTVGAASKQHPQRRPLNEVEETIYNEDIVPILKHLWGMERRDDCNSHQLLQELGKEEFRLGKFFRKKLPHTSQQRRSKSHFVKCIKAYGQLLIDSDIGHDNKAVRNNIEMTQFWLSTMEHETAEVNDVTHIGTLSKCPASYIVNLYSTFSDRFDELLVKRLDYETPTKLRKLFDQVLQSQQHKSESSHKIHSVTFRRGLDLGCGTGLSGMAFSDLIDLNKRGTFVGIDLSPEMVAKAKIRNCYTSLVIGDIISAFHDDRRKELTIRDDKSVDQPYDLIVACDVFCYLGDLSEIFRAVSDSFRLLEKGRPRYFCFSTEALTERDDKDYVLQECARFAHSKAYLMRLPEEHGFEMVQFQNAKIRKNQGNDVKGYLVVLRPKG